MRKFRIIIILISILAGFLIAPPPARAGLVIKLPSSLGLATNLQGYWTFDGADMYESGTVAADKSGNGNNGTLTNGPQTTLGKIGQGLNFDGSNDTVPLTSDPIGTGTVTACTWFNTNTLSSWQFIIAKNGGFSFGPYSNGNRIILTSDAGGTALFSANDSITAKTWYHTCVIRQSSGTGSIYINGVQSGTSGTTGTPASGFYSLSIGDQDPTAGVAQPFNGDIDEVRIYSRALSAAEIKRLYNMGSGIKTASQTSKITSGLLAYYTFDGADVYENGAVVADKSGNGNNGAVTGARVGPGKIGQALHFDGINDLVNTGSDFIGTSALTISVWVYRENAAGTQRIVSNNRTILSTNTAGRILFSSDGATTISSGNNCADAGKWTHVVVTRTSSGVANFYCSSAQYGTADQASGTPTAGTENVFLGNRGSGAEPWDGPLDEIRIYNRVLSAAEIKELYNQGAGAIAGKTQDTQLTTNLVGYWPFNGPDIYESGTVAADKSGQGNNGALSGFTAATGAVPGKIGQGLRFDGSDDLVNAGTAASLDDLDTKGGLTASAWIYPYTTGEGTLGIIVNKDANSNGTWNLQLFTATQLQFRKDGATDLVVRSSTGTITLNKWQHAAVTWDGSITATNVHMYVDGVETTYATQTNGDSFVSDASNSLRIGADGNVNANYAFNGLIDEVRVYNRVLSAAEIKRLYNMGR